VERDYADILALVRGMVHDSQTDETEEEQVEDSRSQLVGRQQGGGEALSPRVLGRVEESLHSADLSNMVRRQFVCALIGEAAPQPLFSELYISIQDLRETLMPGVNLTKSRWLFQHLTETLDRRVLAMLSKSTDRSITGEISINLNISTLLSPEFMAFDDAVIAAMRGSIVIELQKVDIFSDLNDYMFARDFAKERGYRICIDGLTHETMPFVNRDKLGADMVKLIWQTELADEVGPKRVRRLVKSAGASKVILSRCDDEGAVKFGQDIGINMFQGRYIENLIAEESRRREMEMARRRTQNLDFLE
jgi:EAL domain-containing protein (putative c-di-GMP-specific phosphodiesterase class I)